MVDHDQQRVKAAGQGEVGDQIHRQLLERASARGGDQRECRNSQVGVNLHLLTKGTTCNEAANEGGHTQPPVVARQG